VTSWHAVCLCAAGGSSGWLQHAVLARVLLFHWRVTTRGELMCTSFQWLAAFTVYAAAEAADGLSQSF
jgi:hypothetical protein